MANRLKHLRERHGMTQEQLAEQAGCHWVTVSKQERKAELPIKWARIFAAALAEPVEAFYGESPPPMAVNDQLMPVYGVVAGSATGSFTMTSEVVDRVRRPPGLAGATGAYALFVRGSSMEPRFFPGDIVYVAPHRPVRPGDVVVIQQREVESGHVQAWLKVLVQQDEKALRTQQYNPPATVAFPLNTVRNVHKVMTINELMGV